MIRFTSTLTVFIAAAGFAIGCRPSANEAKIPVPPATVNQATTERPFVNSLGMKFVPVPGTDVLFCIWLTRLQDFEAFVKATGHNATKGTFSVKSDGTRQRGDTWMNPGFEQGATHPVCAVNWKDAEAFCNWLTKKERVEGTLTATQSYRMPQDWEWSVGVGLSESREGTPSEKNGKVPGIYPWGTQWPPPSGVANYAGEEVKDADWPANYKVIEGYRDGYPRTSPVGSFAANKFGLYDMGGNLWQWCQDWYDGDEQKRVLRGCSWRNSEGRELLSSNRFNRAPFTRVTDFGFRCVLVR